MTSHPAAPSGELSAENEPRVALVTGCSTGIGRALALALAARGYRTFATARDLGALGGLAEAGLDTLAMDVTKASSVEAAFTELGRRAGRLDVLVNNAGVNQFGPLFEVPLEETRRLFETNVLGLLAVSQAAFPWLSKARGRVVNVGSVVGLLPTPFAGTYCASKAAVHMLSEVLRMEAKPFGIEVVVVQPGGVQSSISSSGARGLERYRAPGSRYRGVYAGIEKRAHASQDHAMNTDEFAREVVSQALATPAPRVVRLGTGAQQLPLLAARPADERDALLAASYGLAAFVPDVPEAGS